MDNVYNRVSKRRRRGQEGFTLIELLVVIAVLAVLAGIVIFNVTGVSHRGAQSACDTDVKTVQTAVDAYYNDNNQSWGTMAAANPISAADYALIVPTYVHSQPTSVLQIVAQGTGFQVLGTTGAGADTNGC
jgi:general secretion pathway protein G